ncbi:MAG TPA: hypothetical protein PKY29_03770 [Ferruginibacter sp.]|nr:hypothetical protein [Ferruginibacter sp.]HRO17221.1 hypothetical protein [Ferruginibacter sp.]HRQ20403.1 hypothetical protein [Ferruginibacter sp.]
MKRISILLMLTPFFIASCQPQEKTAVNNDTHETHAHEHPTPTPEVVQAFPVVQLNNGQKWKANVETTEGIKKMVGIIKNGMDSKSTPQAMSTPLNEAFQEIIKQCTMEGEAHNQLHHFLKPVQEHLKTFSSSDASIDSVAALVNHLATYHQYFE